MSRTQFRANSGAPAALASGVEAEGIEFAGFTGKVQALAHGTTSESWSWLPTDEGAAGADCELETGLDWQHDILPPHEQQACDFFAHGTGDCAASSGVPASRKLQMMASASFMILISH